MIYDELPLLSLLLVDDVSVAHSAVNRMFTHHPRHPKIVQRRSRHVSGLKVVSRSCHP